jgi:hypothetical protein
MNPCPKSGSEESVRLYLRELAQLSDELAMRNTHLRDDGHRIVNDVLTRLQAFCASEETSSEPSAKEDHRAFNSVRREMLSSWLRVDSLVDDLLSTAADELAQFAAASESRIGACERAVRYRRARNMHGRSETEEPLSDPLQDPSVNGQD